MKPLKRKPPQTLEGTIAMGVAGAIVDDHGGEEGHDLEKHKDGNQPCVAAESVRTRLEEGNFLGVIGEIGRFGYGKRRRRLDVDLGMESGTSIFHGWKNAASANEYLQRLRFLVVGFTELCIDYREEARR